MTSISEIIDSLGGNSIVADRLQISPSGVSEMKRRRSIPPRYWRRLMALASEKGVFLSADMLVAAHALDGRAAE